MKVPELAGFDLVGGTALSLLYGHRLSVDLDLFSPMPFDNEEVARGLMKEFGDDFDWDKRVLKFGIFCFINKVKVDIVRNPHPLIGPRQQVEGIRMYSMQDLMAMKIQAILGRGQKKDFWDIAELLRHFEVADFIDAYLKKYPTQQLLISIPQAMTYFSDAEETAAPVSLNGKNWQDVKAFISKKVRAYLK
jgi:predicted nucleotidyltransferase component of viral defense system